MKAFDRALLYGRTVRHLRWEQWVFQPVRRAQQKLPTRIAPGGYELSDARVAALAAAVAGWGAADQHRSLERAESVARGEFRFLNHTETLPEIDWNHRYVSHLWNYNLHYFAYALDLAWAYRLSGESRFRDRFADLVEGWIASTTVGRGDGWEPYAVSLRVVNWIYARLLLGDDLRREQRERIDASLHLQLRYLERRLELHILANHLQKNLQALAVGGLYFSGVDSERWLRIGLGRLGREVSEQVLPDGGHYERSPMYHAIAMADYLQAIALLRASGMPVHPGLVERAQAMVEAYGILCRTNGMLHLFNDAAQGIAPEREWLDSLARKVIGTGFPNPDGAVALAHTGYYGFVDGERGDRLLVDCGEPGPSYQPGHAHCDLLSYELDLGGRPVVVDPGVGGYEGDPLRSFVRSTRAHNTASIAGGEQHELWGTFRMARRARVRHAEQRFERGVYRFMGSYSPYHDPEAVHRRVIERSARGWKVVDRWEGAWRAPSVSYVHFHPDLEIEPSADGFLARSAEVTARILPFGADRVVVRRGESDPLQGWYCPEFGVRVPAYVLELHLDHHNGREFGYEIQTVRSS